ncbi:hypothetical protein DFH06DRAFT_1344899 [Mycena polygramma]|nr:hypothetical protein DFH06DRAFT_1344899 [Mycena polygramma]
MSFTFEFVAESPPRLLPLSEIRELKKQEQRMKSRLRMARLRKKLKQLPPEQQEPYKVRARHARARYRETHRQEKTSCVATPVP